MIDFSIACIVAGLFFISIGCFLLNREIQKNLSEQARLGDPVPRNFANHVSNIADVRKGLRALESYNCNFEKMVNQRLEAVESVADRMAALEKKAEEMGDDIFSINATIKAMATAKNPSAKTTRKKAVKKTAKKQ